MKTRESPNQILSRHDYGPALQGALAWLGSRYLLAEPLNRRNEDRKPLVRETHRSSSASPDAGAPA